MGQHAERLREFPARHGVGGVPLVEHRNGRFEGRITQVGEELAELAAIQEPLVHHRAARQRADVKGLEGAGERPVLHLAPRQVELPFPGVVVGAGGAAHEDLLDGGHGGARRGAQYLRPHGHLAPAQHRYAVAQEHVGHQPHRFLARLRLGRQETHPHSDGGVGRQVNAKARGGQDEEPTWNLCEQPRPVRGVVGGRRAPVRQPRRCFQREAHHLVRPFTALAGDEAHATGVAGGVRGADFVIEKRTAGVVLGHGFQEMGCYTKQIPARPVPLRLRPLRLRPAHAPRRSPPTRPRNIIHGLNSCADAGDPMSMSIASRTSKVR